MKSIFLFLIMMAVFTYVLFANDEKKEVTKDSGKKIEVKVAGNQTICPVSGKKIDSKIFVDFQGSRIKFCSADCEAKFLKSPEVGFKKLADAKEVVDSIQTNCPAADEKLEDYEVFVEKPGRKIYFCCKDCIDDFKKDEAKILEKLPGVKVKDEIKEKKTEK